MTENRARAGRRFSDTVLHKFAQVQHTTEAELR
jgi:hypothetical protein